MKRRDLSETDICNRSPAPPPAAAAVPRALRPAGAGL